MRGVYNMTATKGRLARGSSPHARGLLSGGALLGWKAGIIPACAGFTEAADLPFRDAGDHPRMRGVYPQ